jgi:hypothetical protein
MSTGKHEAIRSWLGLRTLKTTIYGYIFLIENFTALLKGWNVVRVVIRQYIGKYMLRRTQR